MGSYRSRLQVLEDIYNVNIDAVDPKVSTDSALQSPQSNIRARVLLQVSLHRVYDTEAVLKQCYAYNKAFKETTSTRLRQHSTTDPLARPEWVGTFASTEVDWLVENGAALVKAIESDPAVVKKMKDVLGAFLGADVRVKKAIEEELRK
ncbi:hypothetical protein BJX68DRAFT_261592 [Aspergillus pseudodeflectus]|uniref:Uncharacterized protein n=1 Tax=Aspergillus pseudodeflectus TaxID=176178 RepID=A0ABR4L3N1_9EURO